MEIYRIGFTGSREGMSPLQREKLKKHLSSLSSKALFVDKYSQVCLHHGCCRGADEEAHYLFREIQIDNMLIIGHPPVNQNFVSRRALEDCDELRKPKEFLHRDRDIVDETDILLATPNTDVEKRRSGTWTTIRYSREREKHRHIFLPSGEETSFYGIKVTVFND